VKSTSGSEKGIRGANGGGGWLKDGTSSKNGSWKMSLEMGTGPRRNRVAEKWGEDARGPLRR